MKKKIKQKLRRRSAWDIAATTTSHDWGFKPIPGKGGMTQNHEIRKA